MAADRAGNDRRSRAVAPRLAEGDRCASDTQQIERHERSGAPELVTHQRVRADAPCRDLRQRESRHLLMREGLHAGHEQYESRRVEEGA